MSSRRFCICLFPALLLLSSSAMAQVTIKERVEIKPKAPDKARSNAQHQARTAGASDRFYNPPLFVLDPFWEQMGLTLPSTVTISGTVDITGPIGGNQHAVVVYIEEPFGTEREIAWKGRESLFWGGKMYEGQSPYTGTLDKGSFPSVSLYLFDGQWSSRLGRVTMGDNELTYSFNGILYQGTFPPVPVTATATVTGSFLPGVLLDHWNILAQDMTVTGLDSTWVRFAPIDGTGGTYDEEGILVESIYRPWGISPSEAEITARVDAKGDYVFLAYIERADEGEEPGSGIYHSGKELMMSLMYAPFLVYDESRGTFNGEKDTVYVTVIGGGKSKTKPVILKKTQILLGETKYYQAKVQGEKLVIQELSEPALNGGIAADVWGTNPVTEVSGGKLGVYWDKRQAEMRSGTLEPVMKDLPAGLIRLIGRYLDRESTYKVRLTATHQGKTAELVIEVKRPDFLGTSNPTVVGPTLTNGVDTTYQLDSLIIEQAGKEGILPQIIKGIIEKESINFGPSYRYEPFADMDEVQQPTSVFDSTHRYWISSSTDLGDPGIPQHNNVRHAVGGVTGYPGFQYVWNYYERYKRSIYSRRWYESQQEKWEGYRKSHTNSLLEAGVDSNTAAIRAVVLAETSYVYFLRDSIGGRGMVGTIAQTRIAASYGLMQLTYFNGVRAFEYFPEYNYPNNNPSFLPENINVLPIGLKYGILHLKGKLRIALGTILFDDDTWSVGLEVAYWRGLKRYNGDGRYPNPVFGFSNNYLPRRKNQ